MKSLLLPELGATIRYFDIAGDENEVYVYLPGISTPSSSLLHLATHPKVRGHRSILIDYLGSGHSDKPQNFDHSLQNHAKTIAAVLQYEKLSACTIIGHSMGGTVGLYLALQNPELVSRLIMAESNIEAGGGLGTRYIAKFTEEAFVKEEFPKMMKQMQAKALQGDPEALFNLGTWGLADALGLHRSAVALVNLDESIKEAWFKMSIPRSFIIGEKSLPNVLGERLPDAPYPEELTKHGITVPIIPNSGHIMMVDNPEGFAEALVESLTAPSSKPFDDFGRLLIEVRDEYIRGYDNFIAGKAVYFEHHKPVIASLTDEQRKMFYESGADLIDGVLHHLLLLFEQYPWIKIRLEHEDGLVEDLRHAKGKHGDLQGYIFIWAEQFSKERLSPGAQ